MDYKKPMALAAAGVMLASTPVYAGGMAAPVMEPEVVVEESSGSSGGIVIPLLLLAIIAAIATASDTPVEAPG